MRAFDRAARRLRRHPIGPQRGAPEGQALTVVTVQSAAAYRDLQVGGILRQQENVGDPALAPSYPWMVDQMNRRLATSGSTALWCWVEPPRRWLSWIRRHAEPGEAIITAQLRGDHVLVSSFDDWHAVLNNCLHVPDPPGGLLRRSRSERSDAVAADFGTRVRAACAGTYPADLDDWPDELRCELERSWESIFDPWTWPRGAILQGTVHQLHLADVTGIRVVR